MKELTKESIEIASNLSHFGRTNRQLKNKLQSLLTGITSITSALSSHQNVCINF